MAIAFSQRIKSFLWHGAVSLAMFFFIMILVYRYWYPGVLPALMGTNLLVSLLAAVSLLIWPMLTALVVKVDKKEQRRDHAILWILQAAFTAATLYFLFIARPVWINYAADAFEIIRDKDIVYSDDVMPPPEWQTGMFTPPQWLGVSFSSDEKLAAKQRTEDLDGISLARRADALVPLTNKKELLTHYAKPLDMLKDFNPEKEVTTVLKNHPKANLWLPVKGFMRDGVVLTDQNFSFFTVVLLEPWEKEDLENCN